MKVVTTKALISEQISKWKELNLSIGFVPTMGALHAGHLHLINVASTENDIVVVSIFVNPTQFNSTKDFEKYPRKLEGDILELKKTKCSVVFAPETTQEVFPDNFNYNTFPVFGVEKQMEGLNRPGHFNGVKNVVSQFFEIIAPNMAYFGEKDFQQYLVIKEMTSFSNSNIEIIPVETQRNTRGLALSSRNKLLNEKELAEATFIFNRFQKVNELLKSKLAEDIVATILDDFSEHKSFTLEYFSINHGQTLTPLTGNIEAKDEPRCFIAAYLNNVRLIDNISIL